MNRMILHVDGDSFFVACEVARFPHLKGKPVVVGEDRGIACAMSIEAKKLGIYRAMPIFKIKRDFPTVVVLSSHFELYEMYSRRLYNLLTKFSDAVERYSIDECFAVIDEKDMKKYGSWELFLHTMKDDIQKSLGITFSFGLAPTKVLAKIASSTKKPDGLFILSNKEEVEVTLRKVSIEKIWGIGRRLSKDFLARNILTAYTFISLPRSQIKKWFAKPVIDIWEELHGHRVLSVNKKYDPPKSLQATRSFAKSIEYSFVWSEFSRNVEIICSRLRSYALLTQSVQFYIKNDSHKYRSNTSILPFATYNPEDILREVEGKFKLLFKKNEAYKSTGITVLGLQAVNMVQYDLFNQQENILQKNSLLDAVDVIRDKYGSTAISLGDSVASLQKRGKEENERQKKDPYIYGLPLPFLGETY